MDGEDTSSVKAQNPRIRACKASKAHSSESYTTSPRVAGVLLEVFDVLSRFEALRREEVIAGPSDEHSACAADLVATAARPAADAGWGRHPA